MELQPTNYNHDDELTLKELILKFREYWEIIKRNWVRIAFFSFLIGLGFAINAYLTPPTFPAKITFMVNEDEGGKGTGISSILGQFGFGSSNSGGFNLEKIVALSKSDKILANAVFHKATIDSTTDYLANHIINFYELDKNWGKKESTIPKGFRFSSSQIDSFETFQNGVLKSVVNKLRGNKDIQGIFSANYDEETTILALSVNSINPSLSIYLTNSIYEVLSQYYITKTIERQQYTYDILKAKSDSLSSLIDKNQYSILKFQDQSNNILLSRTNAPKLKSTRNIQVNSILYAEVVKNLSLAEYSLKNSTPFFQVIDRPSLPLSIVQESIKKRLIIGFLLGFFLSALFLGLNHLLATTLKTQ